VSIVPYPLLFNNGGEHAADNGLVDFCMLDFRRNFQNRPLPLAMTTQHQFSGIPSFQMSTSSGGLGMSFQNEGHWDLRPQGDTIEIPSRALPSNLSPDTTSHMSHNSLASGRDPSPLDIDVDTLGPPAKVRKVQKYCRIIAKPTVSSPEVIEGIESNNTSRRGPKKGCRQGPLSLKTRKEASLMRKKNACASCFVNRVGVSTGMSSHKLS
jgi:hypothetical protein